MPSLSPGTDEPSVFDQILPGAPNAGFQTVTNFTFRWKRYIVYLSGRQLNILRSPTELVQAITFEDELIAVKAEAKDTGRFVVASAKIAWVLVPITSAWNRVSWTQELVLRTNSVDNASRTLSWGNDGELLLGGSKQLSLFDTLPASRAGSPATQSPGQALIEERRSLWSKPVASPVRFALFNPDAGLIATTGDRDRLVKIWRRLSYEEAVFDHAYLPHEGIVTHIEWRSAELKDLQDTIEDNAVKPQHPPDEACDVLYTICSTGLMSIWRTNGHSELDMLSLYTTIDLVAAIPHSPVISTNGATNLRPPRYAFVLTASTYSAAVSVALKKHPQQQLKHSIEHLKEVSSKNPDIIVSLDAQGRMSAWGLSSIGHKKRPDSRSEVSKAPFHVAHSEALGLQLSAALPTSFETWFDGDILNITAHTFGQSIKWWEGSVENFSSSAALDFDRGHAEACWQGCANSIRGSAVTSYQGDLVSWTQEGHLTQWATRPQGKVQTLGAIDVAGNILAVDSIQHDKILLIVTADHVRLTRINDDECIDIQPHTLSGCAELRLLRLRASHSAADECFLLYDAAGVYCLLKVNSTSDDWTSKKSMIEVSTHTDSLPLGSDGNATQLKIHAEIHPRKPGWIRLVGVGDEGMLWRRDVSVTALESTSSGRAEPPLRFATVSKPEVLVMSSSCAAIVSEMRTKLSIFDLKEGYLEHQQAFGFEVNELAFPHQSHEDILTEHSLLAVAGKTNIEVLARGRYDHKHDDYALHWTTIKRISLGSIGLSITSLAWLGDQRLAISAGNSIMISDNTVSVTTLSEERRQQLELSDDSATSIAELSNILHSPLTCWQPRVLRQLLLHGYLDAVTEILIQLQNKLKFFTNGDELHATLDLDINHLLRDRTLEHDSDDLDLSELGDQLRELDLPYTSDEEQERLQIVVSTVSYVSLHRQALDVHAIRYLAYWRYHVLLQRRNHQRSSRDSQHNGILASDHNDNDEVKIVPVMSWREVTFASQSTTQQPLLDVLVQYYENKLDWHIVRSLGITLWLHNVKAAQSEGAHMASIEQVFDAVGQSAYRATYPTNPADASLFLLAQRKKAVLLSLWRVAIGNREQKSTQNFLRRDFDVEENKTAARKNAYALMGKRRFQYAAAFFLLADDPMSAISILAGQCEDLQLAVSVGRAYCGDGSTLLNQFVQDRVISIAQKTNDRWLLAWAYSLTRQPMEMLNALIVSFRHNDSATTSIRLWQQDDPGALTLYRELRDRNSPRKQTQQSDGTMCEYRAVLRSARVLRRMGLWLLAMKLVQDWQFRHESPSKILDQSEDVTTIADVASSGVSGLPDEYVGPDGKKSDAMIGSNTPSMLDVFSEADSQGESQPQGDANARAAKAAALLAKMRAKNTTKSTDQAQSASSVGQEEKKPTQFKEPAASSILDSFGF